MSTSNTNLYADLVAHKLIIPTEVPGTYGRSQIFEEVLLRFNEAVNRLSYNDQAEFMAFPPVVDRKIMEKVHYLHTFPQLCGSVHSFFGDDRDAQKLCECADAGGQWGELLKQTDVVLSPAACYPVYPSISGTLPEKGRLITVLNWVYRHEPSPEPTRLQSFRMREFIRAGTSEQVIAWRDQWLDRGLELLSQLGLPVQSDIASDPFFGRGGKMRAISQRDQKLKFEILAPVISDTQPTAIASFNYHQDHFASAFGIFLPDGNIAHTACMGFGMERVTLALFKTHGYDPGHWPVSVRQLLWP